MKNAPTKIRKQMQHFYFSFNDMSKISVEKPQFAIKAS